MKTKALQKTEKNKHKNRELVRIAVESVRGVPDVWRIGFEKKSFENGMKECWGDG